MISMFFACSRMSLSVIANGNFVDCTLARSSHDGKRHDIALPDAVGFSMDTKRGKWTNSQTKGSRRGCNGDGGALASAGQLDYHR
jgi:hypothetical protein